MIHEYALEPAVMSDWNNFRYFYEKFGVEHGRLISRFPSKWKKRVWKACRHFYETCELTSDIKLKKIEESLMNIEDKLTISSRDYDNEKNWIENAIEQHTNNPFRAIISSNNPSNDSYILLADELDVTNTLWDVKREKVIPRRAEEITSCARLLIKLSKEIIIVDPFYNPADDRWMKTIECILGCCSDNDYIKRFEIHTKIVRYERGREETRETWLSNCQRFVPKNMPSNFSIKMIRWREHDDRLHPRYILTEKGGIRVDAGLDEFPNGTTDISLLDRELYIQRWNDYHEETSPFEKDAELILPAKNN